MTTETSAEKLAIALMSEARRLYAGETEGHLATADRLAQWATDVRQLGVRLANVEKGHDITASALSEAMARLERLRELCGERSFLVHRDQILAVLYGE